MAETRLMNIIFNEPPHQGKNTVVVAEVDQGAHPGHPLPEPEPPVDPNPPVISHPICLPGMPCWGPPLHVSQPICLPGMPCWEPPDATQPPEPPITIPATLSSIPAGVTPPAAPDPNATVCIADLGPDAKAATGRRTAYCWVNPTIIHHEEGK